MNAELQILTVGHKAEALWSHVNRNDFFLWGGHQFNFFHKHLYSSEKKHEQKKKEEDEGHTIKKITSKKFF